MKNHIDRKFSKISDDKYFNTKIGIRHTLLRIVNSEDDITIFGFLILRYNDPNISKDIYFQLGKKQYPLNPILSLVNNSRMKICFYKVQIPYDDVLHMQVHNPLFLSSTNKKGLGFMRKLAFILFPRRSLLLHGPIKKLRDLNTSIFLRQGRTNHIYITAREINQTDEHIEQLKIFLAFILSRLLFFKKVILLYEKQCEKYEESASVVYEKLLDMGYRNVYFILGKEGQSKYPVPENYSKNIVRRFSFEHYLRFFQAKIFLSSETPYHAVELRTLSQFIHFKLRYMKYKYVFLQHGVMYMISLDAETRGTFRYGSIFKDNSRIVVSSKLEAKHFIEYGNFPRRNLLISGLPKFDKNIRYEDADKIIIMPTWRPWEFTDSRIRPETTKYYKMIQEMFDAVPSELKSKVVVLPHPLIIETMKGTTIGQYFPKELKYEEALRSSRLLITDYSSIAYDAFDRGSNVIFWWKEKNDCMKEYKGHLMLNKSNVFGDVVYNNQELRKSIINNYNSEQKASYIKRFKKIVEFSDRKNTERLIKMLKKDKFL